jgi:hypothetical protein
METVDERLYPPPPATDKGNRMEASPRPDHGYRTATINCQEKETADEAEDQPS